MTRAFVSHATSDRPFVVNELCGLLRALGLDVWYAEESIQSSQQWERAILSGLKASKWFVLVMSPRSAASEWVKDEVNWAMETRPGNIVPILIDDCDPMAFHLRLSRIQRLDFRSNKEQAREGLVAAIVNREYMGGETAYVGINALIQASDLPMYFVDNEFRIRFYNAQLAAILGFKKKELDGKDLNSLVDRFTSLAPEDRRNELRARQDNLVGLGVPDHCEEEHVIDLRKHAGSRYQGLQKVWISADRVYFPQSGEPLGVFVVLRPMRIES